MTYKINRIASCIAQSVSPYLAGVAFYESPNQQGTVCPCAFLQQRSSRIEDKIGGMYQVDTKLDLTYLEDFNLPDLQTRYQTAAAVLDEHMEYFSYSDGTAEGETIPIRAWEREWKIDLDALHYNFSLKIRMTREQVHAYMESLKINMRVVER